MEVLYEVCAGLDVHARTVVVCLMARGRKTIRTFGTMTEDLLGLLDWLKGKGCTHVTIESTGVYWKPVFNILEGSKQERLQKALVGHFTQTQRWVLGELMARYDQTEAALSRVQERIDLQIRENQDPFVPQPAELLDTIPGVGQSVAQTILSEIGADMSVF